MMTRMQAVWVAVLVFVFPFLVGAAWLTGPSGSMSLPLSQGAPGTPGGPGASGGAPTPTRPATVRRETFAAVQARANRVTKPLDAVVLWQRFIDSEPSPEDLARAQEELRIWEERVDDDAVLMNRVWIGGREKQRLTSQVERLIDEYRELLERDQTLEAIGKLREAARIWPENFHIQFYLGIYAFGKGDIDTAIRHLEACNRINNDFAAVLNNLGAAYVLDRQFERGIQTIFRSVQLQESRENVQNLATAFAVAPEGLRRATRLRAARDALNLLGPKYGVSGGSGSFVLMRLEQQRSAPEANRQRDGGVAGNGTGLIITPDGLILTNKHVAAAGRGVMVKFDDGTQRTGEVVVVDDDQDLALIRVRRDEPFSYVRFAAYDNPPDGAVAIIMGFPLTNIVGFSVKTTSGKVASGNNAGMTSDVTLDARVNPGNSGGPVFDEFGHVMAIVAQKTLNLDGRTMDTYGLAISNGRVRRFLAENNIHLEPAQAVGSPLSVQEIVERNRMATVCILIVN